MCVLVSGHLTGSGSESSDEHQINNWELYRTIVENSNDSIIIHVDGKIVFANAIAKQLMGYEEDSFIGSSVLDHVTPECKPTVIEYMTERIPGRDAPSIYYIEVLNRNGSIIPVEVNISAITYENTQAFMVHLRDLSNRQSLEIQLRQAQKMDAVGQLAGGVAHDFNNILQVINGYTELAQATSGEDNHLQDMLMQISQAGERASTLVRQLLTFSRNQLIVTKLLDLNNAITDHLSMLNRIIGENIALEFDPCSDTSLIHADKALLGQILLNICLNARDAMIDGGEILVTTEKILLDQKFCAANPLAEQGWYMLMSISDSGHGMDNDTLDKIFEPFFSTKGITAGTGLGLSTVYGIVTQHDGFITAESTLGEGSVFRIYLPAASVFRIYLPAAEEDVLIEDELKEIAIPAETSKTIIITEDDESVRNLASEILTEAGNEVITASNGEEAVLFINDSPESIDLVILDVIMPVLGGYEAADRIREVRPDMPFIFCSGYSKGPDDSNIQQNRDNSRFLLKPYSMTQLLNAINELFIPIKN